MITAETVATALETGERRMDLCCGWFSNGYFAVKGEQWVALATTKTEPAGAFVEKWSTLERVPVSEAVELRMPFKTIASECECECGNVHMSSAVDDLGQRVFVASGCSTVVDPRLGELLDGLTVFRDASAPPERAILMGYDDAGELIVAVMPLREPVRDPVSLKAVAK